MTAPSYSVDNRLNFYNSLASHSDIIGTSMSAYWLQNL